MSLVIFPTSIIALFVVYPYYGIRRTELDLELLTWKGYWWHIVKWEKSERNKKQINGSQMGFGKIYPSLNHEMLSDELTLYIFLILKRSTLY